MFTAARTPYAPPLMRLARIRLVCAFAASVTGEVTAAIFHIERLHWVFATVAFALAYWQLFEDARRDRAIMRYFMLPALAALAALYVMSTRQAFMPPMEGMHSHAHMVCLSSVFLLIAKYFEKSARFAASEALSVQYELAGDEISVTTGSVVTVPRGGIVPVDGALISGETTVDEAALTGDLARVLKREGDILYCGGVNYDREVMIRALYPREESVYIKRLAAARASVTGARCGLRRFGDIAARVYVLLLLAALCAAGIPTLIGVAGAHMVLMRVIGVCFAATPAVIALLGPLADTIGFAALAKSGIILGAPRDAQALASSRAVTWDVSALTDSGGNPREGLPKTRGTLLSMGYSLDQPSGGIVVADWRAEVPDGRYAVRAALGRSMEQYGAGVSLTRDRAAHLLKAIYICVVLRGAIRRGYLLAAAINLAAIALTALGVLTAVYAAIAAAVCTVGLAANDRLVEKRCGPVTFDRVIRTCKRK